MEHIKLRLQDIRAKDIGKPVEITGFLERPKMQQVMFEMAAFTCLNCGQTTFVEQVIDDPMLH
jgi:DNA replicative helicase MCM subunit Mcm2 (Cdc46/Mcm family)